ncbi:hypothetical protein [Aurantiacibacter sp. D1-12]|uniref:hypothetical protein n=1 Tax=Aurantiacibacter sp. D1-12 TaxID=2993658 RepID=UPI00237CF7A7|nr:hypothetical protein [Aurantiacibacter sp. D1-12]MDE1466893.1 hypothetical protein [Aurantiacibacter sp. D1-12]
MSNLTKQLGEPARLLSMGMPKCGTTTLAALLDTNPAFSVHNLKEPEDFLGGDPAKIDLSGYRRGSEVKYLVDMSTQYGMGPNRQTVFNNLKATNALDATWFVLCLREPEALAASYFRHIQVRRGWDPVEDKGRIGTELRQSTAFRSAIVEILEHVSADRLFVTKLEDLSDAASQETSMTGLSRWLGVAPVFTDEAVKANHKEGYREYHPALAGLLGALRGGWLGRQVPPRWRRKVHRLVTRNADREAAEFVAADWLDSEMLADSRAIYLAAETGVMADNSKLLSMLGLAKDATPQ